MNPAILEIPLRIIKEQELVIGPLAWSEAKKVNGLNIDSFKKTVTLIGNANDTINELVARYERLFGLASREVCRESVKDLLIKVAPEEVPTSLK